MDSAEHVNLLIMLGELTDGDREFILGYMTGKNPDLAVEAFAALMRLGN